MLVAVRSAAALHRVLDVLPVFEGDERIAVRFTLVPGSAFDVDALAALEGCGARTVGWAEARGGTHDLVLTASPKGPLRVLSGPRALLPHGAGFNKSPGGERSASVPSGLDPRYLLVDGEPWADLYALAHDDQLARLARSCPPAAARAHVVGDPTLDRLLTSLDHREAYRRALGTGERRLVVLTSTWGPESLLARRPGLPGDLSAGLPHDAYQLALVLHPNEYSRTGSFDRTRHLASALAAGLVLPRPYEEWAALLVAADAVVTDHGSTALYAAALGRPVIGAYDGGAELLPDSPMAELLAEAPQLAMPGELPDALRAAEDLDTRGIAKAAFAQQGEALAGLRRELYRLLGLTPPSTPVTPHPMPCPSPAPHRPTAFDVTVEVSGHRVRVARLASYTGQAVHHLAAEYPAAGQRQLQSAAVVWHRAAGSPAAPSSPPSSHRPPHMSPPPPPHTSTWTAAGWTAQLFDALPGCRTAAAILTSARCLVRHREAGLFGVRVEPLRTAGRVLRPDPAAVVSAVHAWLGSAGRSRPPASLRCEIGPLTVDVHLERATAADLDYEL